MLKQWIGCPPDNFTQGRRGHEPQAVVIHAYPSLQAADALFANPKSSESCHYVVAAGGLVHQYVDEADTAYHAGLVVNPSWALYRRGINPNLMTIGVAAAVGPGENWSEEMYGATAELIREIAAYWGFPADAEHVVLHAEIRASRDCTGPGFDRAELLKRIASQPAPARPTPGSGPLAASLEQRFVRLLGAANLREGAPNTRARILRTLPRGTDVAVTGFTDRGERIRGNAVWYETPENAFLWAGATDTPQPLAPAPLPTPAAPPVPPPETGIECGIPRIDALFRGQSSAAIDSHEPAGDAVGAIQDLLSGHGHTGLPGLLSAAYGRFGSKTATAVQNFQSNRGLPASGEVDAATLRALARTPASKPRISQVYLSLVLGLPYRGLHKILSIVAQMEGVGKFGALNLNTDAAGLSYGIIQWAQRPGRLPELLRAFSAADRERYIEIFGDGNARLADGLIAYTSRANGGVDARTGLTLDPAFDLIRSPWTGRFEKATLHLPFQLAQVQTAANAFRQSLKKMQGYARNLRTERGIAFMLDVANQFGDGGLKKLYLAAHREGMAEMDLLEAIADESVERMPDKFKQGVRARRDGFLQTARLSDEAVDMDGMG
ncbi:N-acetylmuramoyl-L-alanine amidase [Methylococcus sp. Mc7]|uniref:peptidoglycan recognition protein family protein n=1 Tax=Methylococcus sp. Mc7 TaxID=2860258 RepID=UPI001C527CCA|nr:N-acetylmuramoyl-L-alanine amidase [Methylococcus sp. Mc7]QXP83085.1 N-acetylmuramoyl-L-alanine amidase [Methylococcus sp. Mc7]